jgi:hypothetical protein
LGESFANGSMEKFATATRSTTPFLRSTRRPAPASRYRAHNLGAERLCSRAQPELEAVLDPGYTFAIWLGLSVGRLTALVVVFCAAPVVALAACGDRGGPGYRGPNGKCVGWESIARVCGSPPTQRCTAERAQAEASEASEHGSKIRRLLDDAHERAKGKAK